MNDMSAPAVIQPMFSMPMGLSSPQISTPNNINTTSNTNQMMPSRSVFSNVGITACQVPGDVATSSHCEVATSLGEPSVLGGLDAMADYGLVNQVMHNNYFSCCFIGAKSSIGTSELRLAYVLASSSKK